MPARAARGLGPQLHADKLPVAAPRAVADACDRHLTAALDALAPEWAIGVGGFAEKRLSTVLSGEAGRPGVPGWRRSSIRARRAPGQSRLARDCRRTLAALGRESIACTMTTTLSRRSALGALALPWLAGCSTHSLSPPSTGADDGAATLLAESAEPTA